MTTDIQPKRKVEQNDGNYGKKRLRNESMTPLHDPLETLSSKQAELLDKLEAGYNLCVTALPGCGKSTFISHIAAAFPQKNMLVISYNTALVKATRKLLNSVVQRNQEGCGGVACKTYHGLLTSIVNNGSIKDDVLFMRALQTSLFSLLAPYWRYRHIDLLVIDEGQDMKRAYFLEMCIVAFIMCSDRENLQWCVLGDAGQLLYNFYPINKADARYLTCIKDILTTEFTPRPWYSAELDISFRATPQISAFLTALAPDRKMISGKKSRITDWVTMYLADVYLDAAQLVYDIVKRERREHKLHDIVILCSSVNRKSPARHVVDLLVANGIAVQVERSGILANSNSENITENESETNVSRNKVCVRSICSAKGLEENIVIFINVSPLLSTLTNQQIVALSRAKVRLYIIQQARHTNQIELDTLLTKLQQRHLRVIAKRPIPLQAPAPDAEEKEETWLSKGSLDVYSLFSFLDVQHLNDLLTDISFEPVIAPLEEKEEGEEDNEDEPQEDSDREDDQQRHNAAYIRAVTHSFDNQETHFNLLCICNLALQFAIETWMNGVTPAVVTDTLSKIRTNNDPKYSVMKTLIYDALDAIGSALKDIPTTKEGSDLRRNAIWTIMPSFAKLAIVMDAFDGYRERLHFVTNFDFILSPFVQRRYEAICENLQFLLQDADGKLIWHSEVVGRFLHDNQPLQLSASPSIVNSEHTHLIHFSPNSVITYEDRLMAITEALVVNQETDMKDMHVYVLNLVNTSVERIRLCTDSEQVVVPSTMDDTIVSRRLPCPFLSRAVTFKMLPRNEKQQHSDKEVIMRNDDDATFIERAKQDIRDILKQHGTKNSNFLLDADT